MDEVRELEGFLLAREWRDAEHGVEITLWVRTPAGVVRARFPREEAVLFVPRHVATEGGRRVPSELTTLGGAALDAVYFRSQRALTSERDRLRATLGVALESDVKPSDRFVMERFITGGVALRGPVIERRSVLEMHEPRVRAADFVPRLSVLSLDLETDGWDGPILSAALAGDETRLVVLAGSGSSDEQTRFVPDERTLVRALLAEIAALDPDVLLGWNVVEFDLTVLERRATALGVPFTLGRAGERARMIPGTRRGERSLARVPGRVVCDGPATLRSATITFERYSLEHVARALLGRGKKIAHTGDALAEIRRMHREDPAALAAYNLEDAVLALEIAAKTDLVGFVVERARLTGLPMDRSGGAVAAFDHLYLPRLHRRGFVAPDVGVEVEAVQSPGGHVLEPVPGLWSNVLGFDFKSLYPSLILTFGIDPLGLARPGDDAVEVEGGTRFSRTPGILPEIIETLWQARAVATAAGNAALSRAIKIQMNSFYGVLGTPGCRFFDTRLPTAITRRGHAVIERARVFFEEDKRLPVLYGDTDSLFVRADAALDATTAIGLGRSLALELNGILAREILASHRVASRLELRFDALFERFLLPTMRGSERGRKKGYAGLVRREDGASELVLRGIEAVRTDWAPLARRVQKELLARVFGGEPFEAWLRDVRARLLRGELDDELVYEKRLRQPAADYAAAPPHVRAARMLADEDGEAPDEIAYVVTVRGPEPITMRTSRIDYDHYLDKQLAPACDIVLPCLGTDFARVAGTQMSLF